MFGFQARSNSSHERVLCSLAIQQNPTHTKVEYIRTIFEVNQTLSYQTKCNSRKENSNGTTWNV